MGINTAVHYGVWAAKSGVCVCKSCKKSESEEQLRTAQLLMDLMGDSQSMPMRRVHSQGVRYPSRTGDTDEKVELEPPLTCL